MLAVSSKCITESRILFVNTKKHLSYIFYGRSTIRIHPTLLTSMILIFRFYAKAWILQNWTHDIISTCITLSELDQPPTTSSVVTEPTTTTDSVLTTFNGPNQTGGTSTC